MPKPKMTEYIKPEMRTAPKPKMTEYIKPEMRTAPKPKIGKKRLK